MGQICACERRCNNVGDSGRQNGSVSEVNIAVSMDLIGWRRLFMEKE
jgi:hypothetical protein